ncbi:toprim domain-containing protein [Pedobacter nutrimenti]|uniref:Toprim domain-containing protein n=1 Tax=Pedobacter nutrimenti TaxID=1241337 RepID=A0A318U5Y5_9SPHI|nr:toprim domain-containing protein [Pedobacter nutrimenti]PYF68445.1 Toprim domain-containing protein [Pedobacter nutrimenti]
MSDLNRTPESKANQNNFPLSPDEHEKLLDRIRNIYPRDIDLVTFAQQREYGYQVDVKKSSKQAIVLQTKDSAGVSLDTIIVRRNKETQQYYYTNPNDAKDKGPIWKFVMNRKQTTSYIEIDKHLSGFLKLENLKEKEPQIRAININSSSIENRAVSMVKHFNLLPLTDLNYLKARGFNENVLNSYEFLGRVLNENHKGYINTAFPMYNKDGEIIGLERKNFSNTDSNSIFFGGAAEGSAKKDSVWYSKIWPDKKIDNIVLGETAIDLMSFHMLKNKSISNEHNVYVASNGYWTENQISIVQELIQKHQPSGVVLANDNDGPGRRYNINLTGQLNRPISKEDMALNPMNQFQPQPLITKDNKLSVQCDLLGKYTARLRFTAVFDNQTEGLKIFKSLEDKLQDLRRISSQQVETKIAEISDKKGVYEVTFVNATMELNKAQDIVLDVRGMKNYLSIEKPRGKDFNEDLKVKLGLVKDESLEIKEGKVNQLSQDDLNKRNSFDLSKDLPNSKEFDGRKAGGLGR